MFMLCSCWVSRQGCAVAGQCTLSRWMPHLNFVTIILFNLFCASISKTTWVSNGHYSLAGLGGIRDVCCLCSKISSFHAVLGIIGQIIGWYLSMIVCPIWKSWICYCIIYENIVEIFDISYPWKMSFVGLKFSLFF